MEKSELIDLPTEIYEGEEIDGLREGFGKLHTSEGQTICGFWKKGKMTKFFSIS